MRLWLALSAGTFILVGLTQCNCESETEANSTTLPGSGGGNVGGANVAGNNVAGAGASVGGGNVGGGALGGWGTGGVFEVACQGHIYQCGDTLDNDGDGLIDWHDPDCLGPCDNTEDSYYGGIPGQAGPACKVDCYFDQDSGSGNDDCYWDHICDPISAEEPYYPEPWNGDDCQFVSGDVVITPVHETCDTLLNANGQSEYCLDFCLPLTPNGCDCFGCCELPAGSGSYVWLGSEGMTGDPITFCSLEEVDNPEICHPCTPVTDCMNGCGHCEICIGKPELPPDCFPDAGTGGAGTGGAGTGGSPGTQCDPGLQPCGLPGQEPCPQNQYCITGCCRDIPS